MMEVPTAVVVVAVSVVVTWCALALSTRRAVRLARGTSGYTLRRQRCSCGAVALPGHVCGTFVGDQLHTVTGCRL